MECLSFMQALQQIEVFILKYNHKYISKLEGESSGSSLSGSDLENIYEERCRDHDVDHNHNYDDHNDDDRREESEWESGSSGEWTTMTQTENDGEIRSMSIKHRKFEVEYAEYCKRVLESLLNTQCFTPELDIAELNYLNLNWGNWWLIDPHKTHNTHNTHNIHNIPSTPPPLPNNTPQYLEAKKHTQHPKAPFGNIYTNNPNISKRNMNNINNMNIPLTNTLQNNLQRLASKLQITQHHHQRKQLKGEKYVSYSLPRKVNYLASGLLTKNWRGSARKFNVPWSTARYWRKMLTVPHFRLLVNQHIKSIRSHTNH